jgi:preprotein translocase subunit SecF
MVDVTVPDADYEPYNNRQLALVPLAVLVIALVVIGSRYVMDGTPVELGFAFTGGSEVRFTAGASLEQVRATFQGVTVDSIQPASGETFILTTQATDTATVEELIRGAGYEIQQVQSRSATFGTSAQQQTLVGLGVAFAGMSVLVGLMFRTFVPSVAVVLSAFSDIVVPVAVMNLLGMELTLGAVAALLMLIGYSVDSDILLNNHILRRRGSFYESAYRARRTGVTMTLTSISAMTVMGAVSAVLTIPLLPAVGLILAVGLTVDLMNTYLLNMSLLRYYKYEGVAK